MEPPEWSAPAPQAGEAFEDLTRAVERALGVPGSRTIGVFAAAVLTDGDEARLAVAEQVREGWLERAGGPDAASAELRQLLRAWLDANG